MNIAQSSIKSDLTPPYLLSLVAGTLMAVASLAGTLISARIYPAELHNSFAVNDVINIFIGLPILFGSIWLARHGSLAGLLFWPGALLYILYNYIAYIFGLPFSFISLGYLALFMLSAYIIFDLLRCIDGKSIQQQLAGRVPEKFAGWFLVVFGTAFLVRALGMLAPVVTDNSVLPASETGTLVADLVLSILWIVGGAFILRQNPLGYVAGLGLLFSASMLFVGLIIYLLLRPVFSGTPPAIVDVVVVTIMGLICSIPFVLFLRGVLPGNIST